VAGFGDQFASSVELVTARGALPDGDVDDVAHALLLAVETTPPSPTARWGDAHGSCSSRLPSGWTREPS